MGLNEQLVKAVRTGVKDAEDLVAEILGQQRLVDLTVSQVARIVKIRDKMLQMGDGTMTRGG